MNSVVEQGSGWSNLTSILHKITRNNFRIYLYVSSVEIKLTIVCMYNSNKEECFIRFSNTEAQPRFFMTNFQVFGNRMKHSFECLI